MKRFEFTLIELLIVITILTILAALLFPVILSAKEQAVTTKCISNLRQTGMVMAVYAQENDGYIFTTASVVNIPGTWYGWTRHFMRTGYIAGKIVVGQPVGNHIYSCPKGYHETYLINNRHCLGYGMNISCWDRKWRHDWLTSDNWSVSDVAWKKSVAWCWSALVENRVRTPEAFVFMADSFSKWHWNHGYGSMQAPRILQDSNSLIWFRHRMNCVFSAFLFDGHCEMISIGDRFQYFNSGMGDRFWFAP
ncbi:MAG: type II secretion system protein [Lentisphaerae bacterium]|nr:MAG: type II secretion system protein [Lentisphaerota bacterium]